VTLVFKWLWCDGSRRKGFALWNIRKIYKALKINISNGIAIGIEIFFLYISFSFFGMCACVCVDLFVVAQGRMQMRLFLETIENHSRVIEMWQSSSRRLFGRGRGRRWRWRRRLRMELKKLEEMPAGYEMELWHVAMLRCVELTWHLK